MVVNGIFSYHFFLAATPSVILLPAKAHRRNFVSAGQARICGPADTVRWADRYCQLRTDEGR